MTEEGICAIEWITAVLLHYGDVAAIDFVEERLAAGDDSPKVISPRPGRERA